MNQEFNFIPEEYISGQLADLKPDKNLRENTILFMNVFKIALTQKKILMIKYV